MFVRQKSHKMNDNTKWVLGHKFIPHPASGDFDLAVFETPAQMDGPPPHSHNTYQETFLILEGELEFFINGEIKTMKAGESVDVTPGTLHTFNNRSLHPCKWVNIHSPKGFYKFFEEIGVPANDQDAMSKSLQPELIGKVIAIAGDFDMTIPPPPK